MYDPRRFPRLRRRSLGACALVAGLTATTASADARAAAARYAFDEEDIARVRPSRPHAIELLEEGEAQGKSGNVARAAELFAKASAEAPSSALLARRECEALTTLGRRMEAREACMRAVQNPGSPADGLALIRMFLSGPEGPTLTELNRAISWAGELHRRAPEGAWSYFALCDIAERTGDIAMLQHCSKQLERLVPTHPETKRFRAAALAFRPSWPLWLGWSAIGVAAVATAADALRRRWRGRRGAGAAAAGAVAILLGMSLPRAAMAAPDDGPISAWPIDPKDPESSVPPDEAKNKHPLQFGYWLQDLAAEASKASKSGDHALALKYYRAMAKAVPDRAISFSRMCDEYEALGDRDKAVTACAAALTLPGVVVNDYVHYVRLLMAQEGPLNKAQSLAVSSVLEQLKGDLAAAAAYDELECEVGARTNNAAQLEECTTSLLAKAPDDVKTITFQWHLAMVRGRYSEARDLIERARASGLGAEAVQDMQNAVAAREAQRWKIAGFSGLALALAGGAVWVLLSERKKRRAAALQPATP
jgi:tetratricopeptide (TPR) repeat protein